MYAYIERRQRIRILMFINGIAAKLRERYAVRWMEGYIIYEVYGHSLPFDTNTYMLAGSVLLAEHV